MALKPCVRLKRAGADVLGAGPHDDPILAKNRVGRGTVYYAADPLEIGADRDVAEARRRIYQAVLQAASQEPLSVKPNEPWLYVLKQPTAHGAVHVVSNTRAGKSSTRATLATSAGAVKRDVRDGWPGMAAATADGRLVAAFTDAKLEVAGSAVMDGIGMKGLLSLDGRDVRQSQALLVAPWEPGRLRLSRSAERVAVVGDFRDGRWVGFERIAIPAGSSELAIDADRATCMVLICPADDVPRWQRQLTDAMLHPERIEGY